MHKNSAAAWWAKFTPEERKAKRREYSARSYAKNKETVLKRQKEYRAANHELVKQQRAAYHARHPERVADANKKYNAANKEKWNPWRAAYQKSHPEVSARADKKWRSKEENKEKGRAYSRAYRAANLERVKAVNKQWRSENKVKLAALQSRHRAIVIRATARWADQKKIEEFYETAAGISMLTGDWYHVDHIVPLKSKLVCGLHCEQNMRVLEGVENARKGNRHWPDMP
jgi:hypothetical protein